MAKKKPRPYAIICLWEYVAPDKNKPGWRDSQCWKLVDTYGVDDDGYACTESKFANSGRHSYDDWTTQMVWYDKATKTVHTTCPEGMDQDDGDRDSIPGRVVTGWSVQSGPWLAVFNPPDDHPPWLNYSFGEELKKQKNWYSLIQDGYTLWAGTARAAEKMLWPKEQPQSGV